MSAKPPSLILDPDRVIDALPALFDALERFSFQTNRFVRYLEEAQRGDPRQYLRYGIDEGFTATRIARRTINQLDDIIVRVRLTVQALQEHDQRAQVMMVCVAPPTPPNVATTNVTSGASIVNDEDIIDNDDYGTEPPPSHITDFLDQVLGPDMRRQLQNYWGIISFGGDAVLSFFVIGDIIDILYNLYLGLTGQEVDELTLIFAALGLASDLGWLQPVPSAEDAPNAIFAILKAIVKRLPNGKTRDRLTELLQQAASDPKVANRLQAIFSKFLPRPDLIPWLCNPKVLMAILNEGPEFVDLLLKHGDDAFKATDVLGKNAYSILKQYDEIASIPGANQILKDLSAGGDKARQAGHTLDLLKRLHTGDHLVTIDVHKIRIDDAAFESRKQALGFDPATDKYREYEGDVGARIEGLFGGLDRSPFPESDWVGTSGPFKDKTFDLVGIPPGKGSFHSDHMEKFRPSIDSHFMKQNVNYIILDTRSMNAAQKQTVLQYIEDEWADQKSRLIVLE